MLRGAWTDEEHQQFLVGVRKYGRGWEQIARFAVPTRTPQQICYHYNQLIKQLEQAVVDDPNALLSLIR